ncbi:hypothetical protein AVEN_174427-1, partial [Araneus ventricosus]
MDAIFSSLDVSRDRIVVSTLRCGRNNPGGPFDAEFTMSYITGPHLDTGQWLKKLDLKEYNHIFKSYNGVE